MSESAAKGTQQMTSPLAKFQQCCLLLAWRVYSAQVKFVDTSAPHTQSYELPPEHQNKQGLNTAYLTHRKREIPYILESNPHPF
jgi:hypothetical protein